MSVQERGEATIGGAKTNPGPFHRAHHFTLHKPTMVETVNNHYRSDNSLESLAVHTIPGAEYDSSDRDPPPQCHPNTRADILQRLRGWLHAPEPQKKVLWLYGPAGVGKSAIIQTLAESEAESTSGATLGATLFFSKLNHRDNTKLVFNTIAFQLAVGHAFYREFIARELVRDPKLAEKSMIEQFKRLIIKPFVQLNIYKEPEPLSILIDGLDECSGEQAQTEIVMLVVRLVTQHPTVPLRWVIASRPEPHLQAVFSRKTTEDICLKEEVPINSNQACEDVERFLRNKFEEIKDKYSYSFSPEAQWPTESQFLKLTIAASGLFAFAATVNRFIDDPERGDPVSQLEQVLDVIDKTNESTRSSGNMAHPLATLDALYTCIFSTIPEDVLPTTKRLLGQISYRYSELRLLSNYLGLKQHCVYGALQKLHSVLRIPNPQQADSDYVTFFHASFGEYLYDKKRSGPFSVSAQEVDNDFLLCTVRIMHEATNGGLSDSRASNIILSWPSEFSENYQAKLYKLADSFGEDFELASEDVQRECLPKIIDIYMNLDFGDLASCGLYPGDIIEQIPYDNLSLDNSLVSCGFMETISINAVQLSQISTDDTTYVCCHYSRSKPLRDHRGFDFTSHDLFRKHAKGPLSSEVMAQVLLDLEFLQTHSPSATAIVFRTGLKRVLYFKRELDQIWTYVIPYPKL